MLHTTIVVALYAGVHTRSTRKQTPMSFLKENSRKLPQCAADALNKEPCLCKSHDESMTCTNDTGLWCNFGGSPEKPPLCSYTPHCPYLVGGAHKRGHGYSSDKDNCTKYATCYWKTLTTGLYGKCVRKHCEDFNSDENAEDKCNQHKDACVWNEDRCIEFKCKEVKNELDCKSGEKRYHCRWQPYPKPIEGKSGDCRDVECNHFGLLGKKYQNDDRVHCGLHPQKCRHSDVHGHCTSRPDHTLPKTGAGAGGGGMDGFGVGFGGGLF